MNPLWLRLLCAGALALTSLLAHAQYSWIDDKGMRVFSDRPPPAGTPPERILKTPRGMEAAAPAAQDAAAGANPDAAQPAMPEWKKQEEDYKKRSAQRAEDAAKEKQSLAECAWAREAKTKLERPGRLEWDDKNGKRGVMSEADRRGERERADKILSRCV